MPTTHRCRAGCLSPCGSAKGGMGDNWELSQLPVAGSRAVGHLGRGRGTLAGESSPLCLHPPLKGGCTHPHSPSGSPAHLRTLLSCRIHGALLHHAGPLALAAQQAAKACASSWRQGPARRCLPSPQPLGGPTLRRGTLRPWQHTHRVPWEMGLLAVSPRCTGSGGGTGTDTTTGDTRMLSYTVYWGAAAMGAS